MKFICPQLSSSFRLFTAHAPIILQFRNNRGRDLLDKICSSSLILQIFFEFPFELDQPVGWPDTAPFAVIQVVDWPRIEPIRISPLPTIPVCLRVEDVNKCPLTLVRRGAAQVCHVLRVEELREQLEVEEEEVESGEGRFKERRPCG